MPQSFQVRPVQRAVPITGSTPEPDGYTAFNTTHQRRVVPSRADAIDKPPRITDRSAAGHPPPGSVPFPLGVGRLSVHSK
ncbi:MAG: hypothetical protein MZU95_16430 [Desulfomicrobium escambiense]|nr:hypothetical protein [Desulfomicrobium escambiense]